jgi:dihydrodipicolinate synthase/N-acetylneuraminate lyase
MKPLQGVISILPSIFTEDGMEIDLEDMRAIIDLIIGEGVHGLALLGVASEFYKISDKERSRMIEAAIDHTAGRVPVIVNITRNSTELAIKDARDAKAAGATAVMVVPPSFMPPSNAAIVEHIHAVADCVDLPVIIQYAPIVTGVGIPAETFLEIIGKREGDFYIKAESVPPGNLISTLMEQTDGRIGIFIGNAGVQLYDSLERGATGLMPGVSMLRPYLDIYEAFASGRKAEAFSMFNKFLPVLNAISQSAEMFVKFEKMILKARGIIKSDYCRRPYYTPGPGYERLLDQYNLYMKEQFGYVLMPYNE